MEMMKAAVVEKPEVLVIKQVPVPTINDNEVLIKIKYTGICGTDWSIYKGFYSSDKLPLIPGHEFSGVIEQVGKNAKGLKVGERVTADINMSCGHCFYCRRGQKLMCKEFHQLGIHVDGTFADYVKAPWELVHVLPDRLDFLSGAFIEPVSCVIHSAKALDAKIGSSIAILGAGLGTLHASVARNRGCAPVIVLDINPYRLEIAKQMGADYVIDMSKVDDPVLEVRKLTGGRGADYVIEAIGRIDTYEMAYKMVRPGGTVAAFGICPADQVMSLSPFDIVLGEKSTVGSCAGVGTDWLSSMTLLEYGRIEPSRMFSMIVPLEELEDALHELKTNDKLIKVFVSSEINKRQIL